MPVDFTHGLAEAAALVGWMGMAAWGWTSVAEGAMIDFLSLSNSFRRMWTNDQGDGLQ
jgi:hypothetical protein